MSLATHKNSGHIVGRARQLRQSGSMVERLLWRALRTGSDQEEIKFRYQHPLSYYVADFICLSAKLIVEIDGMSHDSSDEDDKVRQNYFEGLGYLVLRFSNQDVLENVSDVAQTIRLAAQERLAGLRVQTPPRNCSAISTLPQGEGD